MMDLGFLRSRWVSDHQGRLATASTWEPWAGKGMDEEASIPGKQFRTVYSTRKLELADRYALILQPVPSPGFSIME